MKFGRIIAVLLCAMILFSVSVSVSAKEKYFSENFDDLKKFTYIFIAGAWSFYENEGISGGADAKALQTQYEECGVYNCPWHGRYSYRTYDTTITMTAVDDPDSENERFLNLVYVNDNPIYNGTSDERIMMSFTYDFRNKCFRFTEGWNRTDNEYQIMQPVPMEICDDGTEYYTFGMTVERDRIRCFYNDDLIFDYKDTEGKYLIANSENSPFLFWQDGNAVHITNISADRPGYLLEPSYIFGDANGDGKINLADASIIMKYIAKWRDLNINIYAADYDRDGKVNLSDVSRILRYAAE